jgi:hypothetical protein
MGLSHLRRLTHVRGFVEHLDPHLDLCLRSGRLWQVWLRNLEC